MTSPTPQATRPDPAEEYRARMKRDVRLRVCRGLLLAVVLAGIAVRIVQYAWRTSLWHDEALVTLNVTHRTYDQLLRPLDYKQAAPPLFLWGLRWIYLHLGFGEYQLRVISLLCGMGSVVLFSWLAWRLFPAPVAVCVAGMFAFSDKLIWHSAEEKQYSGDVFAAVVLLFMALALRWPIRPLGRLALLAGFGALLLWFSFPSVFVFGAISLALLPEIIRHSKTPGRSHLRASLLEFVLLNAMVLCSFALMYWLTIRGHDSYLDQYWHEHFAPWSSLWLVPWWVMKETFSLCDHAYRSFGWLVLPGAFFGAIYLYRDARATLLWAYAGPVALCLLAAMAHQYPFTGERITVFLVPGLFLACGAALEALRTPRAVPRWWWVAAVPMIAAGSWIAVRHLAHPHSRSSIRPISQYVKARRRAGEAICLVGEGTSPDAHFTSGLNLELLCYWPDVGSPLYGAPGSPRLTDIGQVREKRFWIVYAALPEHGHRYMQKLLDEARAAAILVEDKDIPGGGAFLFEKR